MSFSPQLYTFFTRASLAETAEEQQRILAEAQAELTPEEYEALVGVPQGEARMMKIKMTNMRMRSSIAIPFA